MPSPQITFWKTQQSLLESIETELPLSAPVELLQQAGIGVFVYSDSAQSIEISGTRVVDQTLPPAHFRLAVARPVGGDLTNDFSGESLFQLINSKVIRPANSTIPSVSSSALLPRSVK